MLTLIQATGLVLAGGVLADPKVSWVPVPVMVKPGAERVALLEMSPTLTRAFVRLDKDMSPTMLGP